MVTHRLAIVIVNYRTPGLVIDCVESVLGQIDRERDAVVVVDNASGDGSADAIAHAAQQRNWTETLRVVRSSGNGGFAAGNNLGIRDVDAAYYLLLNSDTIARQGAVESLLEAAEAHPHAGLIGPRLEWPDGAHQVSCFRYRSPRTEWARAASSRIVTRWLGGVETAIPVSEGPIEPDWISFASVLIRREVVDRIGLLDEGYFMYFEDIDYCRRARDAGWDVLYWPQARVVHLRGGSSAFKMTSECRRRLPRYYYESRSRYLAKFYGRSGLWLANLLWTAGWVLSAIRVMVKKRESHLYPREGRDNWIGFRTAPAKPVVSHRSESAA